MCASSGKTSSTATPPTTRRARSRLISGICARPMTRRRSPIHRADICRIFRKVAPSRSAKTISKPSTPSVSAARCRRPRVLRSSGTTISFPSAAASTTPPPISSRVRNWARSMRRCRCRFRACSWIRRKTRHGRPHPSISMLPTAITDFSEPTRSTSPTISR